MGNRLRGQDSAVISDDQKYRYQLTREIEYQEGDKPPYQHEAIFVMLNPSTADHETDDNTITRCKGFAKSVGARQLTVVNLYAGRATKPADLFKMKDPVGEENDEYLEEALQFGNDATVICAWGANAKADRVEEFLALAAKHNRPLFCFGTTGKGEPRHPLYLKGDTELIRYHRETTAAIDPPEKKKAAEEEQVAEPAAEETATEDATE